MPKNVKYADELATAAAIWTHYQAITDDLIKELSRLEVERHDAQARATTAYTKFLELAKKAKVVLV